jgi:predicted Zn-dependent protease
MRRFALFVSALLLVFGCASPEPERLPPAVEREYMLARAAPPAEEVDHLAEAAACVDRGDEPAAVPHLQAHLTARPDAVMIRAYLAELLLRTGKPAEAREQFERFTRQACGMTGATGQHLVHAHTRLMEIAEAGEDKFAEQLHRGIAMVLLVRKWDAEPTVDGGQLAESTLAQAGRALREAERRRPADPRAAVYLAEVYERLGQASAARAAAKRGLAQLPDAGLTAAEAKWLRKWE